MKVCLVGIFQKGVKEMFMKLLPAERFEIEIIDTQQKYDNLSDAEIIILRIYKINQEVIERNKKLKFIQKWGAGFDTVDIEAAGKRNIYVSTTPGVNSDIVSEIAVMHMLAAYRNLILQHEAMKRGEWTKEKFTDRSYGIADKIVGLIGCGNIGKKVAKKVRAFGASVQYYDLFRMNKVEEEKLGIKYVSLEDLLMTSDIISLHLPLNDSTRNFINKERIALMKNTAIIVNTSRGGVINEGDLIEALENNRLLGAGLDCIANEPVKPEDPILKAPNITLTPHIGGTSADLLNRMVPLMVQNIIDFAEGKQVNYVVNKEYITDLTV